MFGWGTSNTFPVEKQLSFPSLQPLSECFSEGLEKVVVVVVVVRGFVIMIPPASRSLIESRYSEQRLWLQLCGSGLRIIGRPAFSAQSAQSGRTGTRQKYSKRNNNRLIKPY